jgi:hypothetical protein
MSMRSPITNVAPPSPWLTSAPYGLALAIGAASALRIGAPGATGLDALRFAGALALPLTLAAALGGAARISLRRSSSSLEHRVLPLALLTALALPPLVIFGGLLKAQTHNRALGGVTFAIASLAVLVFALALGWRARVVARGTAARPFAIGAAILALLALAWALLRAKLLGPAGLDWLVVLAAPALGAWGLALRRSTIGWACWAAAIALAALPFFTPRARVAPTKHARFGGLAGIVLDDPPAAPMDATPLG